MRHEDFDPDGTRLPIKVDTSSNGEYAPLPLRPDQAFANRLERSVVRLNRF